MIVPPGPVRVFSEKASHIPEGSHHYYECTLADRGVVIQLAAITAIEGWLHDVDTNIVINGRSAVNLLNANDGQVMDDPDTPGQALFLWNLTDADAKIVTASNTVEQHRITLRFVYTRAGLTPGILTRKVLYPVVNMEAIAS